MKIIRIICIFLFLALYGCGYTLVNYKPSDLPGDVQHREVLLQLLREQVSPGKPVVGVEVDEKYFKISYTQAQKSRIAFIPTGVTSVDSVDFVYYSNVDSIEYYEGKMFAVFLRDSAGELIYRYYSHQEEKAKTFVDIIYHLSRG